jgi:hypothetical protein
LKILAFEYKKNVDHDKKTLDDKKKELGRDEKHTNLYFENMIDSLKNLKEIYDLLDPKITEEEKIQHTLNKIFVSIRLMSLIDRSVKNIYEGSTLCLGRTPADKKIENIKLLENLASAHKSAGEDYLYLAANQPEEALRRLDQSKGHFESLASVQNRLARLDTSKKKDHMQSSADALMALGHVLEDLSRHSQTLDERSKFLNQSNESLETALEVYIFCEDIKGQAAARMAKSKIYKALAKDLMENSELHKKTMQNQIRELLIAQRLCQTSGEFPKEDIFSEIPKYHLTKREIAGELSWEWQDNKGNIKPNIDSKKYAIDPMDAY